MVGFALVPRWRILSCSLFLLIVHLPISLGQDQVGRYDILLGTNNENSCQLKDTIHSTCNASIAPPPLNVTPIASLCTCNKVFFNIWSACSYASGNNTLPVFNLWTTTCANHSMNLGDSATLTTSKGALGIDIPPWALLDIPGNTTFDLQRAVFLVAHKPWSTLQIVLPIITAIAGAILILLSTFIYRRNNLGKVKWRDEFVHRLRPPQKLKSVDQRLLAGGWEIEPQEMERREATKKVDDSAIETLTSPVGTARDTIPGHPSRYSESLGGSKKGPVASRPDVGQKYPFGPSFHVPIPRQSVLEPVRPHASDHELDINRGWRFPSIHISRPWKRKPERLVEVQPTRRFRVDPSLPGSGLGDQSTVETESTRESSAATSYAIGDDISEVDRRLSQGDANLGLNDEGTNLISHEEREERRRSSGVVTTRSGFASSVGADTVNTSSINSQVKVISPTESPTTPGATQMIGSLPSQTKPMVPVVLPAIPPLPAQPAPAVPNNLFRRPKPRRRVSDEFLMNNQPLAPPDQIRMTSIQEARSDVGNSVWRNPSPIPTRSNSQDQQSSSGLSRSVFNRTLSNEHQRSSSPLPASSSSASLPYYLRAHQRAPSPSPSMNDLITNTPPISRARTPLAEFSSRTLPFDNPPPPVYSHAHQRSSSASTSVNYDDIYGDPFTPMAPHRRGLSADDTASFYMTPEPVGPTSSNNSRPQVGSDPAALFPASVRGAGYRGAPNV